MREKRTPIKVETCRVFAKPTDVGRQVHPTYRERRGVPEAGEMRVAASSWS